MQYLLFLRCHEVSLSSINFMTNDMKVITLGSENWNAVFFKWRRSTPNFRWEVLSFQANHSNKMRSIIFPQNWAKCQTAIVVRIPRLMSNHNKVISQYEPVITSWLKPSFGKCSTGRLDAPYCCETFWVCEESGSIFAQEIGYGPFH